MINTNKIREDFSVLNRVINGKPIIYMDSACVSLKPDQVIEAMNRYYKEFPACAGRSLHKLGKKLEEEVESSRKTTQKFINARKDKEIVFTRNTTESINLVANSLSLERGDVVLTTDKEHNSNLLPWQILEKNKGVKHEIVEFGDLERFKEKIKNVKLVSMVYTSNVDGTSIPVKEIIKIAHENKALVMLDAAQAIPHKEINVKKLDVDFMAYSGHKALGPSGTGVLYGKYYLLEELKPFLVGGGIVSNTTYTTLNLEKPPEKFEAGLQNYSGIIGLGEAIRYLSKIGLENIKEHEYELNKRITDNLSDISEFNLIGPNDAKERSGIISFNIKNVNAHTIAIMLDEVNIMIRSGMHCVHSWFNAHNMDGSARASLYLYNTKEEADLFIENLKKIINIVSKKR